jgi:HPt (histidine-containing phosphotransfer) domain-containing protein
VPATPVDRSVLDALTSRLGDRAPAFVTGIMQTWRAESGTRMIELDASVADADPMAVARVAHSLKSSAAALGAVALADLAEQVETGLREGQTRDLEADRAALRAAVSEADAAFSALWA